MSTSNPRHLPQTQTRDQVLIAHAANQIARTSLSQDDFAQALSRASHQLCPEQAREKHVPDFALMTQAGVGEYLKAASRWLKRVQRWLSGESEMPSWLEEAWVIALEPEFREHCINELASRHGLTGARHLAAGPSASSSFSKLIRALGDVIDTGTEVFDDQTLDEADIPHLPAFIKQLRQVEARAGELIAKAEVVLGAGKPPLKIVLPGVGK